jgi:hypothetical protein
LVRFSATMAGECERALIQQRRANGESGRFARSIPKGLHRSAQGWPASAGLPWVCIQNHPQPQRGCIVLRPGARLKQPLQGCGCVGSLTQGSSQARNPGLRDGIPLGFPADILLFQPQAHLRAVREHPCSIAGFHWADRSTVRTRRSSPRRTNCESASAIRAVCQVV